MEWIIGIAIWVLLCILVGKFWETRGENFAGGFLTSLFLSPLLGFLIGLSYHPPLKKCPECSEFVKEEAATCKHCGHKFSEMQEEKVDVSEGNKFEEDKVNFCLSCGSEVPESARFCPNCGEKIPKEVKLARQILQDIQAVLLQFGSRDLKSLFLNTILWWKNQGTLLISNSGDIKFMKGGLIWALIETRKDNFDIHFLHPQEKRITVLTNNDLEMAKEYLNKHLNEVQCPQCGAGVYSEAKFCPECGFNLEATEFDIKLLRFKSFQDEGLAFSGRMSAQVLQNLGYSKKEASKIVNKLPFVLKKNVSKIEVRELYGKLAERFEVDIIPFASTDRNIKGGG